MRTWSSTEARWYVLVGLIALSAALIRLPILGAGFMSDDYVLLSAMEGTSPLGNTPFNLWSFHDGIPAHTAALVRGGGLPWWTEPVARHAFWRPLSSALLTLAHGPLGHHASGYHALSLALSVLDVLLVGCLYRRLLPARAAAFALAAFAVHVQHVWPIEWLSAIHIPLANALGALGLLAHLRFRADGWAPGRWLSLFAFTLSLLAGESGLCLLAYVIFPEIVSAPSARRRRDTLVAPLLLAAAYVALYRSAGLGAHAIDGYLDPAEGVGSFAATVATRALHEWPRLLTAPLDGLFTGTSPELAAMLPFLVGGALVAVLAHTFLSRGEHASRRAMGGWLVTAALAALPALAGPTDRALYGATIGAAAAVGLAGSVCWDFAGGTARRALGVRVLAALAGTSLLVSQAILPASATLEAALAASALSEEQERSVTSLSVPEPEKTDVVVLAALDQTMGPWGGIVHAWRSGRRTHSWQALSLTRGPHRVTRIDERTLELEPFATGGFSLHLYRNADLHPLHPGDRATTPGLSIEVLTVDSGRPTRIRVRAERSFDDPRWCLAAPLESRLVRAALPAVGETRFFM